MTHFKIFRQVFTWAAIACCASTHAKTETTVFLFSMDGVAATYLPDVELPFFSRTRTSGTYAKRLIPVFPSVTFPNHMTLATGCYPGKHGIVANHFIDKERGQFNYSDEPSWLECEPLWVTGEKNLVKTAVYQWPMSYRPWMGYEPSYHLTAFDKRKTDKEAFDQMLKWVSLPKAARPQLLMTYLAGADAEGHEHGPASKKVRSAMKKLDKLFDAFVKKLQKQSDFGPYVIMIVSDHGMSMVHEGLVVDTLFERYWISGVPIVSGPFFYLYLWNHGHAEKVSRSLRTITGLTTYVPKNFPSEFGPYHPRMGDVVGLLEPERVFLRGVETEHRLPSGAHGYDPRHPSMGAVFMVFGSGVKKNTEISEVHAVDIAATVSKFLGISPPASNQGKPVSAAFE